MFAVHSNGVFSVLFIALKCLLPTISSAIVNFTIYPNPVYVGEQVSYKCSVSAKAEITVEDSAGFSRVFCSLKHGHEKSGIFDNARDSVRCYSQEDTYVLHATANATTDMRQHYKCTAVVNPWRSNITAEASRTLGVLDIPELSLTPKDMTFNDTQNATIFCSSNIVESGANITLTIKNNAGLLLRNTSLNNVELTVYVSPNFHEAEVRCEALKMPRIKAKNTSLRVNYIFSKRNVFNYHSANGSSLLNCAEHVESYPGVLYQWFSGNFTPTVEAQLSYTCKAPRWCNASITCVATNNVTYAQSNVTFIHESNHDESRLTKNLFAEKDYKQRENVIIASSVACTLGTLLIVSIVAVLAVRKRRISRRKLDQRNEMPCCRNDDDVINMKDNELYESLPMMAAAVTSVSAESDTHYELVDPPSLGHSESKRQGASPSYLNHHGFQSRHAMESLLVADVSVAGNLKRKVENKSYLLLLSEQSSTLKQIQEKIEESVPTRNSLKQIAFLLRRAKKGLVLSVADNVNIDGNTVSSNQRLRDFLKLLVERYMNKSSAELRLDLLNFPDPGTSSAKKMAKTLTSLLGIPVYLSSDMYGVNTAVDDNRCVADVYFHRRHIENPVIYTDVDLSKDSRRFPAHPPENVVYSEIVRPALRPPLSAGQ